MESEVSEQIDEESQEGQVLDEIPVQLEESYETVGLSSPTNTSNISRGKYYKQTYRQAWESMPDFKGWLRGVVGQPTRAYCTYCQKTLHAHRLSLLKHTCTIRHQKAAQMHSSRRQNKGQAMEQEIHAVMLEEGEITQTEIDNEDGDTIEYTEVTSELEDEEQDKQDNQECLQEEEEEEMTTEVQQSNIAFQGLKTPISTQVTDAARGCPVTGLQVSLYKLIHGRWTYINEGVTNINGKFSNFVNRGDFAPGRYKLHFDVDRYFDARKQDTLYPFIEEEDSSDEETGDVELQMESNNSLTEEPDLDKTMVEGNNTLGTENQEELPSTSKNNDNNFPEVVKVSVTKNKVIPPAAEDNLQHPFSTPKVSYQKKKLKTGNDTSESQSSQIFEMMKSMYEKKDETAKRDEFDVFGEMVAHNLRHLKSEYSKVTVQQRITSLLYEARISCNFPQNSMQYFTTPLPSPSPPSPYTRTSSSASSYGSVLQSQQQDQTVNPTSYNDNMENPTILESQPQYQTHSPASFNDNIENTSILERAFTSTINDNSQNIQ